MIRVNRKDPKQPVEISKIHNAVHGRYIINEKCAFFEFEEDAMIFKLMG